MHNIKFTMLSIFKCKISDIKYFHLVVQPSPPASPELINLPELKLVYINFPSWSILLLLLLLTTTVLLSFSV